MIYADLLKDIIRIPSISGDENGVASLIERSLKRERVCVFRSDNNIWAYNRFFDKSKKTIMLCSHIDTVPPNDGYVIDPYSPYIQDDKLFGLGSNDAGASVTAFIALFLHFFDRENLKYNLCLAIVSEEEIVGENGVTSILPKIGNIDFAVVGEPTSMKMAVAERGLMVLDCIATGKSGHAAHDNTINPILIAMKDIGWFSNYKFGKTSPLLGDVKMSVTIIKSGNRHNVVPSECRFTVDVRSTECYTHSEILNIISHNVISSVTPRSTRLNPSSIDLSHPIVCAAKDIGIDVFGSKTLSDQALIPFPSVKIGVGDSQRSHTADEYVYVSELEDGIAKFIKLFNEIL
ncbi:MAG: M20/M25/M40 family metallo-hydrolase [Rikenellaceae bacterium]